jgi:hypothetical protein
MKKGQPRAAIKFGDLVEIAFCNRLHLLGLSGTVVAESFDGESFGVLFQGGVKERFDRADLLLLDAQTLQYAEGERV